MNVSLTSRPPFAKIISDVEESRNPEKDNNKKRIVFNQLSIFNL